MSKHGNHASRGSRTRAVAAAIALAIVAITLTACGGGGADGSMLIEEGKFMVGMEMGYPPMEYLDEDGTTPIGFDVDVAAELAGKLGDLEVQYINTGWDGIFSSLDSDRYDAVISAVSIIPERVEAYRLTKPYIANRIVLVTAPGSGITSPESLTGHSVATQTETTADIWMNEQQDAGLELSNYFVYDRIIDAFSELEIGRVDAVAVDEVVALYYTQTASDKYEVVWSSPDTEPLGICVKKGNDALADLIDEALDEMYADGTMASISTKHFGKDITAGVRTAD